MSENLPSKPEDSQKKSEVEIDYIALGKKLISDPKMIEVASLFYSPRELVDLFYICAQHQAGPEEVKKREEEFERMIQRKAEERLYDAMRNVKKRDRKAHTEEYKQQQINKYKLEIAEEILQKRKEVLDKIDQKRAEIRREIKRLESKIDKKDNKNIN